MKFLYTLLFLACGIFGLFLATKNQAYAVRALSEGKVFDPRAYLISLGVLLLGFVQFWSLTRVFPFFLILVLLGASLGSSILSNFLGAISGLAAREKREKVGALFLIWGFERGVRRPWLFQALGLLSLLVIILSWIASLWSFWRWPMGDPEARVWIALFQFTLPQVVLVPVSLAMIWPIVTSEFLDNDVRTTNLIASFAGILYSTVWLLFPVWMLKQEMASALGYLPPFWVLVSVPLILFVIAGVIPHFIGTYRFRSRTAALLSWRKRWLQLLFETVKLPKGETRSAAVDERMRQLKDGIEIRASANSLIDLYRDVLDVDSPLEETAGDAALTEAGGASKTLPSPEVPQTPAAAIAPSGGPLSQVYRRASAVKPVPQTTQEQVFAIVTENKRRLVEWDVRFADLKELLFLYRVGLEAKASNLSGFLAAQIKRIDEELTGLKKISSLLPKALPSALTGIISSVLVALLKAYNEEIVKLVTGLLRGSS